ncbi:insulin gene enhancer protein ISL-2-like [Chelonoidis abingdonii]|uniref:insulin gene enhancer protein ISL-2-like n=1 Tax=Chelonoidis abingdonii TaxID=106734 RepID=UPI0013F1F5FC|nr:insulin gene enhancer protein ISL-2-like [Chelonoidis abingdonii]
MEAGPEQAHPSGKEERRAGQRVCGPGCGESSQGATLACAGCGGKIRGPFLLHVAPDTEWHMGCLRCSCCQLSLAHSPTCFLRDGRVYCRADYLRLFSMRCTRCRETLLPSDLVLRARGAVYHQACFRCSLCQRQLLPGEQFALQLDGLYCSMHQWPGQEGAGPKMPVSACTKWHRSVMGSSIPVAQGSSGKLTRVRTVLNERQLQTLSSCYEANPRPDAGLKEQLVELTGLSPRVIRVWFQNKRCKDKKRNLVSQLQPPPLSLQGAVGTQMVATSPQPQDEAYAWSPVEVQRRRPSWQLVSGTEEAGFSQLLRLMDPEQLGWRGGQTPPAEPTRGSETSLQSREILPIYLS